MPCLALPLPISRGEGRLVAFKRQKPPKWDQKEGQKGPRPIEKIPKNTIFQNPIQKNSFSENFTWVEAVRKNPPAALFIFVFSNGALRARPIKSFYSTEIFNGNEKTAHNLLLTKTKRGAVLISFVPYDKQAWPTARPLFWCFPPR